MLSERSLRVEGHRERSDIIRQLGKMDVMIVGFDPTHDKVRIHGEAIGSEKPVELTFGLFRMQELERWMAKTSDKGSFANGPRFDIGLARANITRVVKDIKIIQGI